MRSAWLAVVVSAATLGCTPPTAPAPDAVELTYSYSNTLEGQCTLTPKAVGVLEARLTEVQLAEYGSIFYSASAQDYFGTARILPGDTIAGKSFRIYSGGDGMIWVWYEQAGERKVAIETLRCR